MSKVLQKQNSDSQLNKDQYILPIEDDDSDESEDYRSNQIKQDKTITFIEKMTKNNSNSQKVKQVEQKKQIEKENISVKNSKKQLLANESNKSRKISCHLKPSSSQKDLSLKINKAQQIQEIKNNDKIPINIKQQAAVKQVQQQDQIKQVPNKVDILQQKPKIQLMEQIKSKGNMKHNIKPQKVKNQSINLLKLKKNDKFIQELQELSNKEDLLYNEEDTLNDISFHNQQDDIDYLDFQQDLQKEMDFQEEKKQEELREKIKQEENVIDQELKKLENDQIGENKQNPQNNQHEFQNLEIKFKQGSYQQKSQLLDYVLGILKFSDKNKNINNEIFDYDWGFVTWLKYSNPSIIEQAVKIICIYIQKSNKIMYNTQELLDALLLKMISQKKQIWEGGLKIISFHLDREQDQQVVFSVLEQNLNPGKQFKINQIVLLILTKILEKPKIHQKQTFKEYFQSLFENLKLQLQNPNQIVRDAALDVIAGFRLFYGFQFVQELAQIFKKYQKLSFIDKVGINDFIEQENAQDQLQQKKISQFKEKNMKQQKLYARQSSQQMCKTECNNSSIANDSFSSANSYQRLENQILPGLASYSFQHSNSLNQQNKSFTVQDQINFAQTKKQLKKLFGSQVVQEYESNQDEYFWKTFNYKLIYMKYFDQIKFLDIMIELSYHQVFEISEKIIKEMNDQKNYTYQQAMETLDFIFELGKNKEIQNSILVCMKSNQQKWILNSINVLINLIQNWGMKRLNSLRPYLNQIELLSNHSNMKIRSSCMGFYQEAYKWMGSAIIPYVKKLKPQQYADLIKIFREISKIKMIAPKKFPQEEKWINDYQELEQQEEEIGQQNQNIFILNNDIEIQKKQDWVKKAFSKSNPQMIENYSLEKIIKDCDEYEILTEIQIEILTNSIKSLLQEDNVHLVLNALFVCQEFSIQLEGKFRQVAVNLYKTIFTKIQDNDISNKYIVKTLFILSKSMSFINYFEPLKECLKSNCPLIKISSMNLIENLLNLDKDDLYIQFYKNIIGILDEIICQNLEQDPYVKSTALNLVAKIMFVYGDNCAEQILFNLNERETKIVNGSLEKFWHIQDCRELKEVLLQEEQLLKQKEEERQQKLSQDAKKKFKTQMSQLEQIEEEEGFDFQNDQKINKKVEDEIDEI